MTQEHEHSVLGGEMNLPVELELVNSRGSSGTERNRKSSESLSIEWEKQSKDLARRFAEKSGLSREEYIRTLPEFGRKPRTRKFNGELEIPAVPVIVETRFALPDILDIVGIVSYFDPQEVKDWTEGAFQTSNKPYTAWLTYIPNTSVEEVRANLLKYERGGTALDGIALYFQHPQILNHFSLKFPGSQVGPDDAPFLSALANELENRPPHHPSLHYGSIESKSPKFACLIASRG